MSAAETPRSRNVLSRAVAPAVSSKAEAGRPHVLLSNLTIAALAAYAAATMASLIALRFGTGRWAAWCLIFLTGGEVLNIGSGACISVNRVIRRINELLGTEVGPVYTDPRPGDVRHSLADIRRARELLGYEPTVDFNEGLRRSIEYYKSIAA